MALVWRPVIGMHVMEVTSNLYVFQFFHDKDAQRVLSDGPWAFDNQTLVCKCLEPGEQPSRILLDHVDYWVHVYDLHSGYMTATIMEQVGNYVSRFVMCDPNNFGGT